jgi:hypothetical protein
MVFSVVEDHMVGFLYALRSPISKKNYPQRLMAFLTFLGFNGVLKDDALEFLKKTREDPEWVEDMQFISSQIERLNGGEVAAATISNYYKAVKLFLEMNRITLSWKILRRGVPTGNMAADDRAPNLEELQRLVECSDPRIKALVYAMASSGIRLGAWDFLSWKHITPEIDEETAQVVAAKMLVYADQNEVKKTIHVTHFGSGI